MRWMQNPRKNYDDSEILNICKLTTLTYPEIAALEGIPISAVLRVCSKQTRRIKGRPRRLTKDDVTYKINQIINFYKKQKKPIDPLKLDRLIKFLEEKQKPLKDPKKRSVIRKSKKKLQDVPGNIYSRKSHELGLVIDFLLEKHKNQENNMPFTMKEFAKSKKIDY